MTGAPSLPAHLAAWLGSWPPELPLDVVGDPARTRPGWDGEIHRLVGVHDPDEGLVLSVPPDALEPIELLGGLGPEVLAQPAWCDAVVQALGVPGRHLGVGVFRYLDDPADVVDLSPVGEWVPHSDARVPAWLRPFNAPEVLLASDRAGRYAGGVGLKLHDPYGAELAVVVEPEQRGRGLGRRLVATAARRVLTEGRVATYLHDMANVASARVADAVGFTDRDWQVVSLFPPAA